MVFHKILGSVAIAALVLATFCTVLSSPPRSARELAFRSEFPLLDGQEYREVSVVADPLLRPHDSSVESVAYNDAMTRLTEAQAALSEEEETLSDLMESRARAEQVAAATKLKTERDTAERELRSIRRKIRESSNTIERQRRTVQKAEETARRAGATWRQSVPPERRENGWKGLDVERNTIMVLFRRNASPRAIHRILRRHRLSVVYGYADLAFFVVRPWASFVHRTAEGDIARLRVVAKRLKADREHVVIAATLNAPLHVEMPLAQAGLEAQSLRRNANFHRPS